MLSICTSLILILIPIPIPILILILIPILTRSRMYGPSSRPLRYDRSVPEGLPVPPYLAFPGYARGCRWGALPPPVGGGDGPPPVGGGPLPHRTPVSPRRGDSVDYGGLRPPSDSGFSPEGRLRGLWGATPPIGLRFLPGGETPWTRSRFPSRS